MADEPPTGPGRPTALTADLRELICTAIREGNYREVAAEFAGVPKRTFRHWLARGRREPETVYGQLLHAVIEAERAAEIKMLEHVFRAAASDPKHAQWFLERKFPERWGSQRAEIALLKRQLAELQKKVPDEQQRPSTGPAGGPAPAPPGPAADVPVVVTGGTDRHPDE